MKDDRSQPDWGDRGRTPTPVGARVARWLVVAVTVIAAALRTSKLTFQPLWYDELYTRRFAIGDLEHLIIDGAARDVHPPGHMMVVRWFVQALGDSELSLRLPSAIGGTLFVPLMYLLGTALGCTRRTSLIAAALGAVSWFPIYYSQEARAYALLLMLATALALVAASAVRAHRLGRTCTLHMAGLALLATAACYLHYFGALYAALVAALSWLLARRGALPKLPLALACLAVAVGYGPWISIVVAQAKRGRDMAMPTHTFLYHLGRDLFSGQWLLVGALFACALALQLTRRPGTRGGGSADAPFALLWSWLLVPLVLTYVLSWFVAPVHSVRNLIIVYPAVLLLLALAIERCDRVFARGYPAVALLAVGLLLWDLTVSRAYYTTRTKEDFRGIAQRIGQETPSPSEAHVVMQPERGWLLNGYFELLKIPHRTVNARDVPGDSRVIWVVSRRIPVSALFGGYRESARQDYRGQPIGNYRPPELLLRRLDRVSLAEVGNL